MRAPTPRTAILALWFCALMIAAGVATRADDTPEKTPEKKVEKTKVTLCHRPPGNPANAHTISVGEPATAAHLKHGDHLGACDDGDRGPKTGDGKR